MPMNKVIEIHSEPTIVQFAVLHSSYRALIPWENVLLIWGYSISQHQSVISYHDIRAFSGLSFVLITTSNTIAQDKVS